MSNRQLTANELQELFAPFLTEARENLKTLSNGDAPLLWALGRKLAKGLSYNERGKRPCDYSVQREGRFA